MSSEPQGQPQRRITRTQTAGNLGEAIFDGRFYAFEKAHRLDPTSSGRGVRQFETAF